MVGILSDESLNEKGFRVLTKGIDLSQFEKNPVVLYNHNRFEGTIGKAIVQKQADKLVAKEITFYEGNEYAKDKKQKFEGGFLNAFSVGIQIIETSDDIKSLLPGQRYATVTKSKLIEFSLCEFPANQNAVRLYDEDLQELNCEELTCLSIESKQRSILPKFKSMDKIIAELGLAADTNEESVVAKIQELKNEIAKAKEDAIDVASKLLVKLGISDDKQKAFKKVANVDIDAALSLIDINPKKDEDNSSAMFADLIKTLNQNSKPPTDIQNVKPTSAEAYAELKSKGV